MINISFENIYLKVAVTYKISEFQKNFLEGKQVILIGRLPGGNELLLV